jgi:hypothetical protein
MGMKKLIDLVIAWPPSIAGGTRSRGSIFWTLAEQGLMGEVAAVDGCQISILIDFNGQHLRTPITAVDADAARRVAKVLRENKGSPVLPLGEIEMVDD